MPTKVALLIESSREYGRGLLRGVAAYARTHGPWSVYWKERALGDAVPNWLLRWQGDGIIARVDSQQLVEYIENIGLACVDLRGRYSMRGVPLIETNDQEVVRLACDHLLEKGFRNFGICGFAGANYSELRKTFAIEYLAEKRISATVCDSPRGPTDDTSSVEAEGMLHLEELAKWLLELPKPVAIVACNDTRGAQVLSVCRESNISVPDDVAVVGVDNDELICEFTTPPLSSVIPDSFRIGYRAGDLLAAMMRGEHPEHARTLVDPIKVVARQSSDVLAVDDSDIVAALKFIRDNACDGITVDDVAAAVPLSRSTLDRRFAKLTGRTAKTEITRVRLNRVRQLLVDTDYKLAVIASMAGFAHPEYMSTMFKEQTGDTPGQYRQLHQSIKFGRTVT